MRRFGEVVFGSVKSYAEALGMSPPNLQKYLRGTIEPGNDTLTKLLELGASLDWLLSRQELDDTEMFAKNAAGRALRAKHAPWSVVNEPNVTQGISAPIAEAEEDRYELRIFLERGHISNVVVKRQSSAE